MAALKKQAEIPQDAKMKSAENLCLMNDRPGVVADNRQRDSSSALGYRGFCSQQRQQMKEKRSRLSRFENHGTINYFFLIQVPEHTTKKGTTHRTRPTSTTAYDIAHAADDEKGGIRGLTDTRSRWRHR